VCSEVSTRSTVEDIDLDTTVGIIVVVSFEIEEEVKVESSTVVVDNLKDVEEITE
jgi:hypothetical protein